ncbi:MAG: AI-2E family transporter [Verrucomicrobiales bacterium]|nr:AI-2E family transporter [Verrucomicrobiae bacterium]
MPKKLFVSGKFARTVKNMAGLNQSPGQTQKVLLSVACVIVIVGGLRLASDLLIPVILALFLALLSLPVTRWLTRHYVPQPLAVLLTIGLDVLVLVGVVNITLNLTQQFRRDVLVYANQLQSRAEAGDAWINDFLEEHSFFADKGGAGREVEPGVALPKSEPLSGGEAGAVNEPNIRLAVDADTGNDAPLADDEDVDPLQKVLAERGVAPGGAREHELAAIASMSREDLVQFLKEELGAIGSDALANDKPEEKRVRFLSELFAPSAEAVLASMQGVVKSAASLLSATFFVGLVMIFILVEVSSRGDTIDAVREARGPDLSKFRSATEDVQKYLGIKTLISAATGILAWMLTSSIGLDAAPLWGMVAFVLNYIPAIGSIIAAIPPILIALVQVGMGPWHSLGVAIGYLGINVVFGNFIEPMLLGKRFGVSTLVVILSVIFWRWMWGPVGMFLAVPLTMIVMVMLENSKDFRWVAVAMGKKSARMPVRASLRRRLNKGGSAPPVDSPPKSTPTPG